MGWPKGKPQSEESKLKRSKAQTGKKRPQEVVEKVRQSLRKRSKSRVSWTAQEWRRQVLERDGHKCVQCGSLGPYFHVHHIVPWKKSVKLRFEVSNGQTLCASCHAKEGWKNKELSEAGVFKKGRKNSPEVRRKISEALKGHTTWNKGGTSWNKGKKCSEETKKKISASRKGKVSWNKGMKNWMVPWNKGIPCTEEVKKRISESKKGKSPAWNKGIPCTEEMKKRFSEIKLKKYHELKRNKCQEEIQVTISWGLPHLLRVR